MNSIIRNYVYISEEMAQTFRDGFAAGESESNKSFVKTSKVAVIEHNDCFEVNGYFILRENFWEPISPDVEKNPIQNNRAKPQAWEYFIDENTTSDDGKYYWFELWKRIFPWLEDIPERKARMLKLYPYSLWMYNALGGIIEGKFRWVGVVSNEEQLIMLNSILGNCATKARVLRIPLAWYRSADTGKFYFSGAIAFLLSSSHFKNAGERCTRLFYGGRGNVVGDWIDCWCGGSVRPFLINKYEESKK